MKLLFALLPILMLSMPSNANVTEKECRSFINELKSYDSHLFWKKLERPMFVYLNKLQALKDHIARNEDIVNCMDEEGRTPLTAAAGGDSLQAYVLIGRYLVQNGASVHLSNGKSDLPPLYYAFRSYSRMYGPDKEKYYLSYGAEYFHEISEQSLKEFIFFLLQSRADIEAVSRDGISVKAEAIRAGFRF